MKKYSFNENWTVRCLTRDETPKQVSIPHDAMISEPRTPDSRGEGNIGWYIGGDYEYTKKFDVPAECESQKIVFEFEGVYQQAEVYINGEKAGYRPYGYTNFYVEANDFLKYGEENEIRVIAKNSDQPNSRWYSGTGIYRPVNMWTSDKEKYIVLNGVKVKTVDYKTGKIDVKVTTSQPGDVLVEILDGDQVVCSRAYTGEKTKVHVPFTVPNAKLWDTENPNLYQVRVTFGDDVVVENFGIRTLAWTPAEGMTINGKRVILRGACIHHDNGFLGACAFPEAEERKVRLHKENGYNALRSAHNPCSKAILDACDRLGMLMMDEFVDAWYMHKTRYDYVTFLKDWWRQDLADMVDKDYNHPSVIMYSTGNEVAETAQEKGIRFTGQMTEYLNKLDETRPVTCGINIFFNFLSSIGFGVYSDEKAEKEAKAAEAKHGKGKKSAVGSEFYNKLACVMGDKFMKFGATLYPCDLKTRGAYANMDIAGYNYGIWRYRHDVKKYPNRLILGSETFCKDAWLFWKLANELPQVVGDFVWAGMDYIGETGMGAPEYGDYRLTASETQMTGGNGRIDITGKRRAEAAYTLVALGQEAGPLIGVTPVDRTDNPNLTGWSLTKAVESWSWNGCEGKTATVEVYSMADRIQLQVNGATVAQKKTSKTGRTIFKVPYEAGRITAIAYDADGKEQGRYEMRSADDTTVLQILPETETAKKDGLLYVRLRYTDENGIWKPLERHFLNVKVENGELLGLGCANSYVVGNYTTDTTDTYYGEALAIIRADGAGDVTVSVYEEGKEQAAEKIIPLAE